jgi:glycosyltransferase involved in cell wall biosynthesis
VHVRALNQPRLLATSSDLATAIEALSAICASVSVYALPSERSAFHRSLAATKSALTDRPFDVVWLECERMSRDVQRAGWFDLVHVDTIGLWPMVNGRRPVVLGHHNVESALMQRRAAVEASGWRRRLMRRDSQKLRRLEAEAARTAAVNVVVSRLDAEQLQAISPHATIEVVENGVDTEYWTPGGSDGSGLVFAGTLGWYPNRDAVEFLLSEIWPALSGRPRQRLVLIGRDPPPIARAASMADDRVRVTGFVPDVRPLLRDASIYVCPIRVGGGTRLKILDALAMAKPIVSTAIGVEGLDLVEEVHYLRAETADDFVRQITRLESHPELRERLGATGRRVVEARYDWGVVGPQLDHAYARATMASAT